MPDIIRSTSLREVVHAIREDPQTLPSRQDSEQARAGRIGIHTSGRTGGYGCIPEEDGAGGTAGGLPAARTGGRVSECVDKRQAGTAEVPCEGTGEGGYGTRMGMPDVQRHAVVVPTDVAKIGLIASRSGDRIGGDVRIGE